MNAPDLSNSSWGKRPKVNDTRALRRYVHILRILATTGEMLVPVLALAYVLVAGIFLYTGNFENLKFEDGTSLSCILNGATGEIINVK